MIWDIRTVATISKGPAPEEVVVKVTCNSSIGPPKFEPLLYAQKMNRYSTFIRSQLADLHSRGSVHDKSERRTIFVPDLNASCMTVKRTRNPDRLRF